MTVCPVIPIAFATDDNYVAYLSVAIQSIIENAKSGAEYRLFILYETLSLENQNVLLYQVNNQQSFHLDMIDVSSFTGGAVFQNLDFSRATYYRFVLPYIMQEYPFVIYLDCDIVCTADIAELLSYDYSEYALGATRRVIENSGWGWLESHAKGLGIKNYRHYFNAGVLVFNTKKFCETVDMEKLFLMAKENNFRLPDQDILNIVFEGKVLYVPVRWNLMTDEDIDGLTEDEESEYEAARENPAVLHFSADKPLEGGEPTERKNLFWDYAGRTPFINELRNKLSNNMIRFSEAENIDPEHEECVFLSNNKRETANVERSLEQHRITYKTKHTDKDFRYKIFVSSEDVEQVLNLLIND
ncbi:LPS 1,2-glucosyltransferase [Spirochaetia bacterium]|nr:LPS 1,2-glucosyltransferase [Spirochaetia bacterium]